MPAFILLLAGMLVAPEGQRPLDARHVALSSGRTVVEIDASQVAGRPVRLAWSPDGRTLFLRFTARDRWGNERNSDRIVSLTDGRVEAVTTEPPWAAAYWEWKSALTAPGLPAFRISVESRDERKTATGVVSAGSMAQSGGDPSLGAILGPQGQAIAQSTMQAQTVTTTTLKVKGELLAEYVNEPVPAGAAYGWAPAGMDALVYVGAKRRMTVMDASGHRQPATGAGDWTVPSWSPDGMRIACVRRESRKKFSVQVFTVVVGR